VIRPLWFRADRRLSHYSIELLAPSQITSHLLNPPSNAPALLTSVSVPTNRLNNMALRAERHLLLSGIYVGLSRCLITPLLCIL